MNSGSDEKDHDAVEISESAVPLVVNDRGFFSPVRKSPKHVRAKGSHYKKHYLLPGAKSLAKGTFVREKARGGSSGKSAHRKPFARGYTPGRKTRGRTPGITRDLNLGINPGKFPHFCLQIFCNTDCACAEVTVVKKV
ncbi:hypothetical protein MTR_7g102100 [Medicago truncatula]|uniref:Uncharacterized protein n=1 Tax=Medicago truncatula TaxID=3880 RepID=G7L3V9_MEDTR|nr:hypothetical protein MTR_7g102100 [Medicago truncatula]